MWTVVKERCENCKHYCNKVCKKKNEKTARLETCDEWRDKDVERSSNSQC